MIKRTLYPLIKAHIETPGVFTIIIGPRQAGKTYLMRLVKEDLEKKGEKTMLLNLDLDKDKPFFESQEKLLQKIRLEIGENGYVFLDEIQRKKNAGLFLKGLYDMLLPYKFVISGSGSLELKEEIHESLPGRKRLFDLLTLSFEEFVDFKTEYKYSQPGKGLSSLSAFFDLHREQARQYFEEYLNFGGYPRIVLTPRAEDKLEEINDIYTSYLERDIVSLLNLEKTEELTNLVQIIASQAGSIVNFTELSRTLKLAEKTVKRYLWYLEKTYIIQKVTPFSRNIRNEIVKSPEFYFVDLGLKNHSISQFGIATQITPPAGFLFENFVYLCLREQLRLSSAKIHFWRTLDKAEVDFVIDTGLEIIPIEVKYQTLTSRESSRSFQSFLEKYKPKKAYIVHMGEYMERVQDATTIFYLPFYMCQSIVSRMGQTPIDSN